MLELSRLEIKDILHNLGPDVDPDVLSKLQAAVRPPIPGTTRLRDVIYGPHSDTVQHLLKSEFRPTLPPGNHDVILDAVTTPGDTGSAVLTPRLEAAGWTQEDVDRINADKERGKELNAKLAKIVPIVGEENASNIAASFAPPDLPPAPPPAEFKIGETNQYGDACRAITADGKPAFQCHECGKGYTYNRSVGGGCTFCFLNGGGSTVKEEDDGAIHGEDSNW